MPLQQVLTLWLGSAPFSQAFGRDRKIGVALQLIDRRKGARIANAVGVNRQLARAVVRGEGGLPMARKTGTGLLTVWTGVDPEVEAEFNEWYERNTFRSVWRCRDF